MSRPVAPAIREALGLVRFLPGEEFLLGGERFRAPPAGGGAPLVERVAAALYSRFHCGLPAGSAAPDRGRDLVPALHRANRGRDRWEPGWTPLGDARRGRVLAGRGERQGWFRPDEIRSGAAGRWAVLLRKGTLEASPGFYTALGDRWDGAGEGSRLRFYWNVAAEDAAALFSLLTGALEARAVPYLLKAARRAGGYARREPMVLYVARDDLGILEPILSECLDRARSLLRRGSPPLTFPLAPGLSWAEDPPRGVSFGGDRCRILAEALCAARLSGRGGEREALGAARKAFAARGLDPAAPHLGPGSRLEVRLPPRGKGRRRTVAAGSFLETADRIASRLCRLALWSGERCAWIAPAMEPSATGWRLVHRIGGADLYAGSPGIGLFLAECHRLTGDPVQRRAALGAFSHALGALPVRRLGPGFHGGLAGLVFSLLRGAELLDAPPLRREARRIAAGLPRRVALHDVLSGTAGSVPALLLLHEGDPRGPWLDAAAAAGDRLIRAARREPAGWCWPPGPGAPGLTGLSHGAAGVAWALLELGAASGEARFLEAARRGFEYERGWFSPEHRNWPDLRGRGADARRGDPTLPHGNAWCHGAPGIALVRARAAALTGDPGLLGEARAALATAGAGIGDVPPLDTSLCHGLCGRAEALAHGGSMVGDAAAVRRARAAAAGWAERIEGTHAAWPGGVRGGGEGPGLMLGLAGVGHLYLRLQDPGGVAPVLLPLPVR